MARAAGFCVAYALFIFSSAVFVQWLCCACAVSVPCLFDVPLVKCAM